MRVLSYSPNRPRAQTPKACPGAARLDGLLRRVHNPKKVPREGQAVTVTGDKLSDQSGLDSLSRLRVYLRRMFAGGPKPLDKNLKKGKCLDLLAEKLDCCAVLALCECRSRNCSDWS